MEKPDKEEFQEKVNLLNAILEETADAIFIKDLQGRYLAVNKVGARNFGKTPEELIGKDNSILDFPPEAAKEIEESDRRVMKTGETLTYEIKVKIEGVPRTFLTTKSPYRDHLGKIIGVIGISRDITDRKLAEETLRAEHAYRKPIEEAMLAGVAAVDLTGRLIYVNSAFCKMVGWPEQELLGKTPPFPYWVPEEIKNNMESVKSRLVTGNTSEFKTQFQRQNSERFPVLIKTAPLTDGYGKEIGFVATVSDITVQKSAEIKMQESYQLLQSIMDGTTDAIYLRDLEGRYLMINSSGASLFGKSPEEIIGKRMSDLFSPEFVRKTVELDRRCIKSGKTETLENEMTINGVDYVFLTTRGPIRNHENKISGFFGISRDITDRKTREEDHLKIEKLESLGLLAGGIAHDFNNILTAIIGNISLAKSFVESKEQLLSRLSEAERASLRASELAQQLLTFSKGGAPIKKTVAIQKLIEHTVQFALIGSNVQSQLFFQEGLWPVEVDEGQMNQVIQNLIINAKQAMPLGGTIRIEAKNLVIEEHAGQEMGLRKGNYLSISIQDQGTGIPKEHLAKIFDPYFTTKTKGSGLGLSITHSIIRRHKGYITAESKPGVGTTFFIYLPASPQTSVPKEKVEIEEMTCGQGRVLVMDDEESILNVLAEMLRHLGYEVTLARSGTEAVKIYKKARKSSHPFDVVITDLTVPGDIGGVETLRRLREIDPQVIVIVSSGYSNDPAMSDFKTFGFSDCLKKPYRAFEVSRTVKKVLKSRRLDD